VWKWSWDLTSRLGAVLGGKGDAHDCAVRLGIPDPSSKAYKQRRGAYFYYNRAAIVLACAQATAMRIDVNRPTQTPAKKTNSPRSRPPLLSPPSTRTPPLPATSD